MSKYPCINTLRYMGNKRKLLDFIIPEIEELTSPGDKICDIMSGTCSIGYALSNRNIIISNDVQHYSFVISSFLLSNKEYKSSCNLDSDINDNFNKNMKESIASYFFKNYSNTYFSEYQCKEIDSIIYAISKINSDDKKYFYTSALLSSMCICQSTTGHFAQYLSNNLTRVKKIQEMSVKKEFDKKVKEFKEVHAAKYKNSCFNLEYENLFKSDVMEGVKCFYLDPPYTGDQYSRFYHLLETASKNDEPTLNNNKAKYREERFMSKFCYKKTALQEFEKIISFCFENKSHLIISYTHKGVVSVDSILSIAKKYYKSVTLKEKSYSFSTQGSGNIKTKEILFILKN